KGAAECSRLRYDPAGLARAWRGPYSGGARFFVRAIGKFTKSGSRSEPDPYAEWETASGRFQNDRMIERRDFITLIGGAAAAWPLGARAQQAAKMPRVGLVSAQSRSAPNNAAFEKRLAELGYQDGKDFIFDFVQVASLEGWETAFQGLGARKVDIMVAAGPEVAVPTCAATSHTIPIVMIAIDYDPFAHGYVTSLARPSGNITGIFLRQIELTVKRLQLVKDAFPDMQAATVFWDRISADQWEAARDASAKLG